MQLVSKLFSTQPPYAVHTQMCSSFGLVHKCILITTLFLHSLLFSRLLNKILSNVTIYHLQSKWENVWKRMIESEDAPYIISSLPYFNNFGNLHSLQVIATVHQRNNLLHCVIRVSFIHTRTHIHTRTPVCPCMQSFVCNV